MRRWTLSKVSFQIKMTIGSQLLKKCVSNSKDTKENNEISKSTIQSFWGYKLSRVLEQSFWLCEYWQRTLCCYSFLRCLGVAGCVLECVLVLPAGRVSRPSPLRLKSLSAGDRQTIMTLHIENFLTPDTTILKTDLILLKKLRSTECPKAYPSWNRHNWKVLAHHLSVNDGPLRRIY